MGGMPPAGITIESSPVLDLGEVVGLYREVGWTRYADDATTLEAALAGSSRVVAARVDGRLVGLARVISDGATICYLQDVLVCPDAQRTGVGRALVRAALEPYASVRQKVLLTDDEPRQRAFYESLGYRETRDYGSGSLRAFVRFDD
jgi:GNAT superfamily N-acetyltransferase